MIELLREYVRCHLIVDPQRNLREFIRRVLSHEVSIITEAGLTPSQLIKYDDPSRLQALHDQLAQGASFSAKMPGPDGKKTDAMVKFKSEFTDRATNVLSIGLANVKKYDSYSDEEKKRFKEDLAAQKPSTKGKSKSPASITSEEFNSPEDFVSAFGRFPEKRDIMKTIADEYANLFKSKAPNVDIVDEKGAPTGQEATITASGAIEKTYIFGGRASKSGKGASAATANETGFVDSVNSLVDRARSESGESGGKINVKLGGVTFEGVTGAQHVGSGKVQDGPEKGSGMKPDVILNVGGKNVALSLKLPDAQNWLSGDAEMNAMGQEAMALIKDMIESGNTQIRLEKNVQRKAKKDGKDVTYTYPNAITYAKTDKAGNDTSERKPVNVYFRVSDSVAKDAVFGKKGNTVDYVVKGSIGGSPLKAEISADKTPTYTWNASLMKAPDSIGELKSLIPEDDWPYALLRLDTSRGLEGFKGIRPVIVTKSRAAAGDAKDLQALAAGSGMGKKFEQVTSYNLGDPYPKPKPEEGSAPEKDSKSRS